MEHVPYRAERVGTREPTARNSTNNLLHEDKCKLITHKIIKCLVKSNIFVLHAWFASDKQFVPTVYNFPKSAFRFAFAYFSYYTTE